MYFVLFPGDECASLQRAGGDFGGNRSAVTSFAAGFSLVEFRCAARQSEFSATSLIRQREPRLAASFVFRIPANSPCQRQHVDIGAILGYSTLRPRNPGIPPTFDHRNPEVCCVFHVFKDKYTIHDRESNLSPHVGFIKSRRLVQLVTIVTALTAEGRFFLNQ
jgi:hypothetical protein